MRTRTLTVVIGLAVLAVIAAGLYQVRADLNRRLAALDGRLGAIERQLGGKDGIASEVKRLAVDVGHLEEKASVQAITLDGVSERVAKLNEAPKKPAAEGWNMGELLVPPVVPLPGGAANVQIAPGGMHIAVGNPIKIDEATAKQLGLTPEQTAKLNDLIASFYKKEQDELAKGVQIIQNENGVAVTTVVRVVGGERDTRWKQFIDKQLAPLLNADQLAKFKELFPTPDAKK